MNHRRFPSSLFPLPIVFILQVMLGIPQSLGNRERFECPQFECGNISAGYPFSWPGIPPGCGHPGLQLDCEKDRTPTIEIVGVRYQVLDIYHQTLRIARLDVIENDFCNPNFQNSILDHKFFDLFNAPEYENATVLYGCKKNTFPEPYEYCSSNKSVKKDVWILSEEVIASGQCSDSFTVPIHKYVWERILDFSWVLEVLQSGFEVKWKLLDSQVCQKCNETGGACRFNLENQTICQCPKENFTCRE